MPVDAGVQQEVQSVVVEVAESVADAFDLLDQQVDALGGSVGETAGGVEREDLGFPGEDGLGEPDELGDLGVGDEVVERDETAAGVREIGCGVDLPAHLLGHPRGADLAVAITDEASIDAVELTIGEAFVAAQQQPSDPVERITGAATVAEGLVLHSSAHVVNGAVGEPVSVEPVNDHGGVRQRGGEPVEVAAMRVQRHLGDAGKPVRRLGRQPRIHRCASGPRRPTGAVG